MYVGVLRLGAVPNEPVLLTTACRLDGVPELKVLVSARCSWTGGEAVRPDGGVCVKALDGDGVRARGETGIEWTERRRGDFSGALKVNT